MIVFISPAKGFNEDLKEKYKDLSLSKPVFESKKNTIIENIKKLSVSDISKLMKIKENLALLNFNKFSNFDSEKFNIPAILFYSGQQYKSLDPHSLNNNSLEYLKNNVIILSGLYGIVRAFDMIYPYRLEMQTKIKIDEYKNLYDYWGSNIYNYLKENSNKVIVNLASTEYSNSVKKYVEDDIKYVTCTFKVLKGTQLKVQSTASKKARGLMLRYLAENNINDYRKIKDFNLDGYSYSKENSSEEGNLLEYVFIKE